MNICDLGRNGVDALIEEWIIGKNSAIERAALRLRLFDGLTFEQIAEKIDRTPKQARTIYHRAENRLLKHIPG